MKTPRELLFERHRAAESKLDVLRQEAVAGLAQRSADGHHSGAAVPAVTAWRDLLLSFRWHLAGLGAAWLLILGFNLAAADHSQTVAERPPAGEILLAWQEKERLLAEILGPAQLQPPEPPKTAAPQPRSERRRERFAV